MSCFIIVHFRKLVQLKYCFFFFRASGLLKSNKLFIGLSLIFQGISGLAMSIADTAAVTVLMGLSPENINTMMV